MNPDNDLKLNDKEIEKITTDLAKAGKKEFGASFKNAAIRARENPAPAPVLNEKQKFMAPLQTPVAPVGPTVVPVDASTLHPDNAPLDKKELYSIVKPLRTYERDVAETIRNKNESVASVNLAAQKKRQENHEVRPEKKVENVANKSLILLVCLVLVLAAGGIFVLSYYFLSSKPVVIAPTETALITTDSKQTLDVSSKSTADAANAILTVVAGAGNANSLNRIDLTKNGQPILVEGFFELFGFDAPPTLVRALGPKWVFGFDKIATTEPFVFLSVNSFDIAFDGMLHWEKNMIKDLGPIFIKPNTIVADSNSTTGTNFSDLVIRNKDVRVLKDNVGNIILLYSFLDQKDLVITTNEETFKEILDRFFASQIVR